MKISTLYSCQKCGYQTAKWLGKCPDCGTWNSFVEEIKSRGGTAAIDGQDAKPVAINEVHADAEVRLATGISEFDRVLGGGVVAGSLVLIGGDPGIGKSTLLLQATDRLARAKGPILYVSGEESARQTRLRGERLNATSKDLFVLPETALEKILLHVQRMKPRVVVVDSIQTIFTSNLESAPGSVSQVRECAGKLMLLAKSTGIPVFIVGHVTKDGSIAGPRVLEHMVDTVLYFEGDPGHPFRILRAVKNRFGSTNEIGVFEMKEEGLCEVVNPSELFLAERPLGVPGSVVVASVEGTRPLLVEIQALVTLSPLGTPRRTTIGIDHNRLALLVAVLEKKVGLQLLGQDIFVNVAGGVRLQEPAVDLGIIGAVASSHLDKPVSATSILLGEVGLAGEIRGVTQPELRIREAMKLGFTRFILPAGTVKHLKLSDVEIVGVRSVDEALEALF